MSSSHPDHENAAPTAPVSPGLAVHGQEGSWHGGQDKNRCWSQVPLSQPTSLLTQALAANHHGAEKGPAPTTTTTTTTTTTEVGPSTPRAEVPNHHGLNHARSSDPPQSEMAALALGHTAERASNRGVPPSSFAESRHDRNDSRSPATRHREFLYGIRGRGTSLERTEKERRVHVSSEDILLSNPGDTALPSPPTQRAPTPSELISKTLPTEGVRASYRSWRDPCVRMATEKAWSIGEQEDGSDQGGRVEKLITEAMAGVEPNNRSRKSSHSLGFFKEGLPEDKPKRRESRPRGHSKDGTSPSKGPSSSAMGKLNLGQDMYPRNLALHTATPAILEDEQELSLSPITDDALLSRVPSTRTDTDPAPNQTHKHTPEKGYTNRFTNTETSSKEQARQLPPQLLADIRKHHNLAPGPNKGGSFSQSLPITESESLKDEADSLEVRGPKFSRGDTEGDDNRAELSPVQNVDDEDESGEEQISSALFLPHKSSHQSPEEGRNVFESVTGPGPSEQRHLDTPNHQRWLEEYEVPSRDFPTQPSNQEAKPRTIPPPIRVKQQDSRLEQGGFSSESEDILSTRQDIPDDEGYTTAGEELSVTDDHDLASASLVKVEDRISSDSHAHVDNQQAPKRPLEAIELIPYRHQVGGHTTLWRFSKRAVCKQLSNRENEFYEKIERYHPQLLKFLPRYIGVLNVTLQKQIRRKSTRKDGFDAVTERQGLSHGGMGERAKELATDAPETKPEPPRIISQSMKNSSSAPIPTVTFADNRHIIPKSFLQPHPQLMQNRSKSDGDAATDSNLGSGQTAPAPSQGGDLVARPTLTGKQSNSWGATMINKKLRYEVFGEAFLQQPIPIHRHKKPASQHRSLPNRRGVSCLRTSNSESSLQVAQQNQVSSSQPAEESIHRKAMKAAAEQRIGQSCPENNDCHAASLGNLAVPNDGEKDFSGKAGTSAPEPEIVSSPKEKRQRRYSSGGLRRKPTEVADDRGNLKYFEEADDAGYKGDAEEDVFPMDLGRASSPPKAGENGEARLPSNGENTPKLEYLELSKPVPAPTSTQPPSIHLTVPRPVNPKEAQTQRESRVEYFLLLEDLTAGMKRPCIMDLKMGTRQYGVYANEEKQASQRRKGAATTSHELGVRVCGLQVWDVKSQSYIYLDKYFGRNLKVGREFQDALTRFLYNGVDYSSVLRHIPTILRKLSELEVLVRGLDGYRFYAASLLMVYDSDAQVDEGSDSGTTEKELSKGCEIDFKIADFANSVTKEDFRLDDVPCPPQHRDSPDRGFLRGLKSLRKYFLAIQHELYRMELGKASKSEDAGGNNGFMSQDDESDLSY